MSLSKSHIICQLNIAVASNNPAALEKPVSLVESLSGQVRSPKGLSEIWRQSWMLANAFGKFARTSCRWYHIPPEGGEWLYQSIKDRRKSNLTDPRLVGSTERPSPMNFADLNEMAIELGLSIGSESWPEGQNREVLRRYPGKNHQSGGAIEPSNICFSAGLDDLIDLIIRCLCRPVYDRIAICPPVYHMYQTSATVNDVATVTVPLDDQDNFQIRLHELQKTLSADPTIKLCFLSSPGNPTGHPISINDIKSILGTHSWSGVVVVDEAYIDFSTVSTSCINLVQHYPRLIVLQTLSKAFGLASIRVGFAIACSHLCEVFNKVRKPYAVSGLSIALATTALTEPSLSRLTHELRAFSIERSRFAKEIMEIDGIGSLRGGLECNFVMFEVLDNLSREGQPCNTTALWLLHALEHAGILVRFKGHEYGCWGCLRITICSPSENRTCIDRIRQLLQHFHTMQSPAEVIELFSSGPSLASRGLQHRIGT